MSSDHRYTVGIVGAGRIGASFDSPDSQAVLTHAHAAVCNVRTELIALVDLNEKEGMTQAKKWGTRFYKDLGELFSLSPDIIVIATSDVTQADLLVAVLAKKPRLVIVEKPVVLKQEDVSRVGQAYERAGIPVLVNFSRRFDPRVDMLARDIASGSYGSIISASAVYGRGVLHNGSHLFDLLRQLFGKMSAASIFGSIADYSADDPTLGGFASFERCPRVYVVPSDGRAASIFELDIIAEKKRIRLVDEGTILVTQEVIEDPLYTGFRTLGPETRSETGLAFAMERLFAHAVAVLDGEETPRSTLEDAFATFASCQQFARSDGK